LNGINHFALGGYFTAGTIQQVTDILEFFLVEPDIEFRLYGNDQIYV
jgi:hypothetical protein